MQTLPTEPIYWLRKFKFKEKNGNLRTFLSAMFWDIFSLTKRHKYRIRYRLKALNNTVSGVI